MPTYQEIDTIIQTGAALDAVERKAAVLLAMNNACGLDYARAAEELRRQCAQTSGNCSTGDTNTEGSMTMKPIKVADATNAQLDWLVTKCDWAEWDFELTTAAEILQVCYYSTEWSQMGRIIEREGIDVRLDRDRVFDPDEKVERWYASKPSDTIPDAEWVEYGPTPLIAAARCYVTSKLGETVEVPEELT